MRLTFMVVVLACLANSVSAKELLPWQTVNIDIKIPGDYSVPVDDRTIFFKVPEGDGFSAGRAKEVITRGGIYDRWFTEHGEYQKGCFGMSRDFYPLGIPPLGIYAQFSLQAKLYVKAAPAMRNQPGLLRFHDPGDFSKPEDLLEKLRRATDYYVDKSKFDETPGLLTYFSPVKEIIINGRKWFHYLANNNGYPNNLSENYVTGLAPDRYLAIEINQHPVPLDAMGYPYPATGYPTYPSEDKMPSWMKKTHKYKELVINSLRITKPEGSTESDLYDVDAMLREKQSQKQSGSGSQ